MIEYYFLGILSILFFCFDEQKNVRFLCCFAKFKAKFEEIAKFNKNK